MRPKKRVLCIDNNEDRLGQMRYRLFVRNYMAISATTADEAREASANFAPDLVLASSTFPSLQPLLDELRESLPAISHLVVSSSPGAPEIVADATLHNPSSELLIEHIHTLCARKRGPRSTKIPLSETRRVLLAQRRLA